MTSDSFSVDIAHFDRLLQGTNNAGVLLLDARNPLDSQRWHPEGPGIGTFANVPYSGIRRRRG